MKRRLWPREKMPNYILTREEEDLFREVGEVGDFKITFQKDYLTDSYVSPKNLRQATESELFYRDVAPDFFC